MKKDIPIHPVTDIGIGIVPDDDDFWEVYLFNLKEGSIENLIINTVGYGEVEGDRVETSRMRHYFEKVEGKSYILIEPIQTKLFQLANEYWISFQHKGYMYDKKFVFVKGSISEDYITNLPLIDHKGVLIL